jgi:DNA-binding NtrC family response regulator
LRLEAGDSAILGSEPGCDLVLSDPTVSGRHVSVEARGDGFLARDLGSTNGTWVDQVRISEAWLTAGCQLRLGRTALAFTAEDEELVVFPSISERFQLLSGKSRQMRQLFGLLERFAPTELTVLVLGETGTGKELAARSVHLASKRAKGPFVVFDCGRASREFVESELFGHEKGAFTGAAEARPGAFELADGGTLFIDELGELGLDLQPKLLRALEQRRVRRLGASRETPVDVRIVAATNRELSGMVSAGTFREDLYYRLAVFQVAMPPLRERREDLPALVERLLADRGGPAATSEALAVLASQPWNGNVRELVNVLELAIAVAGKERIRPGHLMLLQGRRAAEPPGPPAATAQGLAGRTLQDLEREAIVQTLAACGNNKTAAARSLGIAASTLFEKLKRYRIE